MDVPTIATARLILRDWRPTDRAAMFGVNGDPTVMATIGPVMSRAESDAMVDRMVSAWAERGYGLWCVERRGTCIGFIGLSSPWFESAFRREIESRGQPCVEVGWRLAASTWGHGYAPEGAAAALNFGFDQLGLNDIVSFTAATNHNSRRVMEKLGLRRDPGHDFDHPSVAAGDPLRSHVLYRINTDEAAGQPWRSPGRTVAP